MTVSSESSEASESMSGFERLLNKNSAVVKWLPTSVDSYRNALLDSALSDMKRDYLNNIVYALQYLEYIHLQIDELRLTDVLRGQLMKTYIITSMGIIESIFAYLVRASGHKVIRKLAVEGDPVRTNTFQEDGVKMLYEITKYRFLDEPDEFDETEFEKLINVAIGHRRLLSLRPSALPYLKGMKRIRNRVHLNQTNIALSDYMGIHYGHWLLSRHLLYLIFSDEKIAIPSESLPLFTFMRLSGSEAKALLNFLGDPKDQTWMPYNEEKDPLKLAELIPSE